MKGIVIDHYMPLLFSNVEELFELNLVLFSGLVKSTATELPSITNAFLPIIDDIGKYNIYCTNQTNAMESIDRLIETNPKFVEFINGVKKIEESRQEDFASYITKPFQRITRYPLLVGQLMKYSSKSSLDAPNLVIIKEHIDAVVLRANEAKRTIDSVVKMIEIQSSFTWQGDVS